jgi:tRNA threonylcarbamoyl adenosine modification protein YjeE
MDRSRSRSQVTSISVGSDFSTDSAAATEDLAARLAGRFEAGDLLLLEGGLGAGKTTFVRGLVRGLGGNPSRVQSPTFTLVRHYPSGLGRAPLAHVDLFRLESGGEVAILGLDELLENHIVAVEWGERLRLDYPRTIQLAFSDAGRDRRRIRVVEWYS